MANALRAIPLLLFPALLYAAVAGFMQHDAISASLDQVFFSYVLPSGAPFEITRGHGLIMLAAGLLVIEVIKSTSVNKASMVESVLAFLAFTVAFGFFLLSPAFGTIEFALIMIMMLVDFVTGFIVMAISARRDVSFGGA